MRGWTEPAPEHVVSCWTGWVVFTTLHWGSLSIHMVTDYNYRNSISVRGFYWEFLQVPLMFGRSCSHRMFWYCSLFMTEWIHSPYMTGARMPGLTQEWWDELFPGHRKQWEWGLMRENDSKSPFLNMHTVSSIFVSFSKLFSIHLFVWLLVSFWCSQHKLFTDLKKNSMRQTE